MKKQRPPEAQASSLKPQASDLKPQASSLKPQPSSLPGPSGHFGIYGGKFVPETLMSPLEELEKAYLEAKNDPAFQREFEELLQKYVGRPTPLFYARRFSEHVGGRVYLKREDLCHTGAHKINNALGQALLARRMGKTRIIAETGAGQHGVATATVCALLGLQCEVYMGTEDMRRQALNVLRMELLGARVTPVDAGSRTLKDAINEAMRDWVTNVENTHYLLGSVLGAHPYPMMVRDFQSVIGREARRQILEAEGRLPDLLVACVGGGSNSIGLFHEFLGDQSVRMIGVEAGGFGKALGQHAARFEGGGHGVLHGTFSYVLQDERGQIAATHSISAGLDYPSIGPEHAYLRDIGRVQYTSVTDEEALEGLHVLSRLEGIIPALESAHAVAKCLKLVTGQRSSVTGQRSSVTGQRSSVTGQRSAVTGQRSAVSGQRSPVTGQRSAVTGQRSPVTGQRSSLTGSALPSDQCPVTSDDIVIINLSGRGDKDVEIIRDLRKK